MPTSHSLKLSLTSAEQTGAFAQRLAPVLSPGDVILLNGDVGAGKTHFARCAIRALLTVPEDVPSPTYTLVQTYPGPLCDIWHADLYRLTDITEIEELGLLEAFTDAICFIEWPDRLGALAPQDALSLTLAAHPQNFDTRELSLTWTNQRWTGKIESAAHALT